MKLLKKLKATKLVFGGPSTWIQDSISWACTFMNILLLLEVTSFSPRNQLISHQDILQAILNFLWLPPLLWLHYEDSYLKDSQTDWEA